MLFDGENSLNIYKATSMLLSGAPKAPVDVLFFHGRSFGDETGLFEIAGQMYRRDMIRKILVFNNEGERYGSNVPFEANLGKAEYRRRLRAQGILAKDIICPERQAFHTQQENDTFLEHSKKEGFRSGVILAQPHQVLRAMLGMLKAMQEQSYVMEVYAVAPKCTLWQEVVRGNQGLEEKRRVEHIGDELKRVYDYQQLGWLATFEELFIYLAKRENKTLRLGINRLNEDLKPPQGFTQV